MKIYLVGGAVRDQLLGYPVKEKDWVVVGSTPENMISQGFKPVGKDFPVFLHPDTHEEYALARTERKTQPGYTGFTFHAAVDVTLEEDLKRRDLTINAMAYDDDMQQLIDPYHGKADLEQRLLRHVSSAFIEDPVRILRVARFAARYKHLAFTVAPETLALMKHMVDNHEIDALVPERVWQEFNNALAESDPIEFFHVLNQCGALTILFPEVYQHLAAITITLSADLTIRFASLLLKFTADDIQQFCARYPIPKEYCELSLLANSLQSYFYSQRLSVDDMAKLFNTSDVWRRPERLAKLLMLFEDSRHIAIIKHVLAAVQKITIDDLIAQQLLGEKLGQAIMQRRYQIIEVALNNYKA